MRRLYSIALILAQMACYMPSDPPDTETTMPRRRAPNIPIPARAPMGRLARDVIRDLNGQYNLDDFDYGDEGREADGWPEGMDHHANPLPKTSSKHLLDGGNAGTTLVTGIDSSVTTPTFLFPLFEARGDEYHPDQITVHVFVEHLAAAVQSRPNLAIRADWGVQNFVAQADIDIVNGMMFSLNASYLRLQVFSFPDGQLDNGTYRVGASASYGVRAAHAPPMRTIYGPQVLANAIGTTVDVPKFARGVYTVINANASNGVCDFVLQQLDENNTILSAHPYIVGSFLSPLRIPLHNDCKRVRIRNLDAAIDITRVSFLFDLSF